MSWSLPKLPGYSFRDVTQLSYHVPRKIDYINGFPIVKPDNRAIGGSLMDAESSRHADVQNDIKSDFLFTYGRVRENPLSIPKPHWVRYDKKILTFKGHLLQKYLNLPSDNSLMRSIILIYYLEDDTLTVIEPHVQNSGLLQGKLIKRDKILKNVEGDFWHWKDLSIGIDISIFGLDFHISACDEFTREFMKSQGLDLLENETISKELNDYQLVEPTNKQISTKCKRFLEDDGQVLQFDAIWDDSETEHGEVRKYKILFYPFDSSIAIKECHVTNGGRDPFPMLLRKTKVPKNWNERLLNSPMFGHKPESNLEYYKVEDLIVGETISILGRNFLLCDCDLSTRNFYKNSLNINQGKSIYYDKPKAKQYALNIGPHIGIGDPDDTLMSCISFHSKPPFKDIVQYNLNTNKRLRYLCEMISVYPENSGRRFALFYNLNDGTIRMDELPVKNSGMMAGRFSGPSKITLPGETLKYYTPEMFYIGAIIIVKNHKFRIVDADLFVYQYMHENPEKFPPEIIENIRNHHYKLGNLSVESRVNLTTRDESMVNADCQLEALHINGNSMNIQKDTPKIESEWRPTELPEPLQGIECSMTLPESSEKLDTENQPVVCLTGPIPETHEITEIIIPQPVIERNVEDYITECTVKNDNDTLQIPMAKKVSFKDVSEEN